MSSTAVQILRPAARPDEPKKVAASTRRLSPQTIVLLVIAISAAYVGWRLFRGWIPHDDGALGQSAERLLNGQLPHRDFDDIYTGGLSYLNAAAFALLGTSLATLRIPLFVVFLGWVPAVYYIASRFVGKYAAAALALLAVVWSLPNYTAAMPSWYNLFFATFGLAALLRYLEDSRPRWLVIAGVAGSLSILVKIIGLYYVAGALLFLVFRAHVEAREEADARPASGRGYAAFVTLSLALFVVLLIRVIGTQLHAPEASQFVIPAALIAVLIARQEWIEPAGVSLARFRGLARLLVPFAAGLLPPIILFVIPYVASSSVGALIYGVFVLPMKRFGFATAPVLPLWTLEGCIPLVVLGALVMFLRGRAATVLQVVGIIAALTLVVLDISTPPVHRFTWHSARNFWPVLSLVGAIVLWRVRDADRDHPLLRQQTIALLSMTALINVVQFPFFAPIYFCYVAPLVILSAAALYSYMPRSPRVVPATVVGYYMLFGLIDVNSAGVFTQAQFAVPLKYTERLALPRAGIEVSPFEAKAYSVLIPMLQVRARGGYTWASRDCPEIYFLSGLKNPSRTLFDFFDDTTNYTNRTLRMLDDHHITAIVMNRFPQFSSQFTQVFAESLFVRYPYSANIGRYHVRWRP